MNIINLLPHPVQLSTPDGDLITIQPQYHEWFSRNEIVPLRSNIGEVLLVNKKAPLLPKAEENTVFIMKPKDVESAQRRGRHDIYAIVIERRYNENSKTWDKEYHVLTNDLFSY